MGKKIRSPSTEPHEDGRPTYNGVRPGSPRGSLMTLLSLSTVPCSPQYGTFHLGFGRPELLASACHSNHHQGTPSTTVTTSHLTQGRVEYESTIPPSTDEGLDLWEAVVVVVVVAVVVVVLIVVVVVVMVVVVVE